MEMEYLILLTFFEYGHAEFPIKKEDVRKKCEDLKHAYEKLNDKCHVIIEVANIKTGEIREFWNNKENKIKF